MLLPVPERWEVDARETDPLDEVVFFAVAFAFFCVFDAAMCAQSVV